MWSKLHWHHICDLRSIGGALQMLRPSAEKSLGRADHHPIAAKRSERQAHARWISSRLCDHLVGMTARLMMVMLTIALSFSFATGTLSAAVPNLDDRRVQELLLLGLSPHDLCLTDELPEHQHHAECVLCLPMLPAVIPNGTTHFTMDQYYALVIVPLLVRDEGHRHNLMVPPRGPPALA